MRLHGNAALSWCGRRLLADRVLVQGWTLTAAAEAAGVSVRCAGKWVGRYRREGEQGLFDRSSAPRRVANRTAPERVAVIGKLRRLRMTAAEIAETLQMPLSTVSAVLTRSGMGRLGRLGLEPARRYERSRPGELVHIDVKKLAGSPAVPATASTAGCSTTPAARSTPPAVCAARRAGSSSTSPSTTTAASPTPKYSQTRKRPPRSASSAARSPSSPATGSRSSASSPTTAAPTSPPCTRSPAAHSASATYAHGHADHRQTAKQSASSAPCSTAGPTAPSTAQATNAPEHLTAGSATTTINDDTQPSATNPRSPEPTCSGPTSRRVSHSVLDFGDDRCCGRVLNGSQPRRAHPRLRSIRTPVRTGTAHPLESRTHDRPCCAPDPIPRRASRPRRRHPTLRLGRNAHARGPPC